MTPAKKSKNRIRMLDLLRGFSVFSMVLFHAMYDLVYLYGLYAPWYKGRPGYLWQQSICWTFILVAGASLHYGRNARKHGLVVLGCALVLTLVTSLVMPEWRITFGILHMLGTAILLFSFSQKLLQKVPPALGLGLSAFLFALTKPVAVGYLGFLDRGLVALPEALYSTAFLFPLGFPNAAYQSSDYFPLLPWFFLLLTGWYGWALCKPWFAPSPPGRTPLDWAGRKSLWIYMLHQPLIFGLFGLLSLLGVLTAQ